MYGRDASIGQCQPGMPPVGMRTGHRRPRWDCLKQHGEASRNGPRPAPGRGRPAHGSAQPTLQPRPTQFTDIETSEERDGILDALVNLDDIAVEDRDFVNALKVTIRFLRDTIECFEIPRAHP